MEFLGVLALSVVATFVLRRPIKAAPWAFYGLSVLLVASLFAGNAGLLGTAWKPLILLLQRCMLPLALFTVVMYIGVFPKDSRVGRWLRPIRAELSIIACILALGHMCLYLSPYLSRALAGAMGAPMAASFIISVVLFALLLVLGVTSFDAVKRRMTATRWKNIQRLAYLFFGLAYAHLLFMIAPAALHGGEQATLSVAIYSVVFVGYAVARAARWHVDRAREARASHAETPAADDFESDVLTPA